MGHHDTVRDLSVVLSAEETQTLLAWPQLPERLRAQLGGHRSPSLREFVHMPVPLPPFGAKGLRQFDKLIDGNAIADMPIAAIATFDVERFLRGIQGNSTPSQFKRAATLTRKAFNAAVLNGQRSQNPCDGMVLPRMPRKARTDRWFTLKNLSDILECDAIPTDGRLMVAIAYHTRWPLRDLAGLRWRDVHLEITPPHVDFVNVYSVRSYPLYTDGEAVFRSWRAAKLAVNADDLVFPNIRRAARLFRSWLKAAGITEVFYWGDLSGRGT